jgi:hypothetical protein
MNMFSVLGNVLWKRAIAAMAVAGLGIVGLGAVSASAATTCHTVDKATWTHTTYREVREHGRWVRVPVHHKGLVKVVTKTSVCVTTHPAPPPSGSGGGGGGSVTPPPVQTPCIIQWNPLDFSGDVNIKAYTAASGDIIPGGWVLTFNFSGQVANFLGLPFTQTGNQVTVRWDNSTQSIAEYPGDNLEFKAAVAAVTPFTEASNFAINGVACQASSA